MQREFEAFLRKHEGIVWKVAHAWCRQAADREDLAQEIGCQAWRSFSRFDPRRPFGTWLYRIALNVAISTDRKRKRRPAERLDDHPEPVGRVAEGPGGTESAERQSELFAVIDALNPVNRALLLLSLDEQPYAAIAEVLGLSETNVATRLSRLKQKLRDELSPEKGLQ